MTADRDWTDEEVAVLYGVLADLPIPPGTISPPDADWDYDENPPADTYSRWLHVREWEMGDVGEVAVCVSQIATVDTSGDYPRVTWWHLGNYSIYATVSDDITSVGARWFAAALLEAADVFDERLASLDQHVSTRCDDRPIERNST